MRRGISEGQGRGERSVGGAATARRPHRDSETEGGDGYIPVPEGRRGAVLPKARLADERRAASPLLAPLARDLPRVPSCSPCPQCAGQRPAAGRLQDPCRCLRSVCELCCRPEPLVFSERQQTDSAAYLGAASVCASSCEGARSAVAGGAAAAEAGRVGRQVAGPWLKPSGEENPAFMAGLRAGLLNAVVMSPGISISSLAGWRARENLGRGGGMRRGVRTRDVMRAGWGWMSQFCSLHLIKS